MHMGAYSYIRKYIYKGVRVRAMAGQKRAHSARGPKWNRKILQQCMRRKPHTNLGTPLRTGSPCYGMLPKPTLPKHEGKCAVKVSMRCSGGEGGSFIAARSLRTDQVPLLCCLPMTRFWKRAHEFSRIRARPEILNSHWAEIAIALL